MDAVKFVKEYLRMCTKVDECEDCPVCKTDFCTVPAKERSQESAEEIVEEWSAAHPRKTRQSVFLEQYPNVRLVDGVVDIAPCQMEPKNYSIGAAGGACKYAPCVICRSKFWMQEVE